MATGHLIVTLMFPLKTSISDSASTQIFAVFLLCCFKPKAYLVYKIQWL